MLLWMTKLLIAPNSNFNIFSYLILRAIFSFITSLCLSLWIGANLITFFKKLQISQFVRNDGPKSHFNKSGTPTMGGIMIITSIIISILVWASPFNPYIWCATAILIGFGTIGFIDDYYKVINKNSCGLNARWKYFWMSTLSLSLVLILYSIGKNTASTQLILPFFKNITPQLDLLYILLGYFVITGTGNAVNLTDGLDGLAIIPIIFISGAFSLIALTSGNIKFATYFHLPYLKYSKELVIICAAIIGSGLGFLWFNTYPALIFMGDVGSLSLGGTLGTLAVLLRQEFLLLIIGGVFVFETLSVILQVSIFKIKKQRIFKMAPIHHHYELKGYPEPRIIVRFWIVSAILFLLGLISILKTH